MTVKELLLELHNKDIDSIVEIDINGRRFLIDSIYTDCWDGCTVLEGEEK